MIAELVSKISLRAPKKKIGDEPQNALPRAGCENGNSGSNQIKNAYKNVRFPWTHNNEAVDFQFPKILPSMNHVVVPFC
jgi:hypothetical protein